MLPITTYPNSLAAKPVQFTTTASPPSVTDDPIWAELASLAEVAVPASVVDFYDDALPDEDAQRYWRDCRMLDVQRTTANARTLNCSEEFHEQDGIARRWCDLRAATWYGLPDDEWPKHWLPVGGDGTGNIYAISVESDDHAPIVLVKPQDEAVEYVAESIADHAQNVRARMACDVYGELMGMPLDQRLQFVAELRPDTHISDIPPASFVSEYQRRLIVLTARTPPGWRRVILAKLLGRTIT